MRREKALDLILNRAQSVKSAAAQTGGESEGSAQSTAGAE